MRCIGLRKVGHFNLQSTPLKKPLSIADEMTPHPCFADNTRNNSNGISNAKEVYRYINHLHKKWPLYECITSN